MSAALLKSVTLKHIPQSSAPAKIKVDLKLKPKTEIPQAPPQPHIPAAIPIPTSAPAPADPPASGGHYNSDDEPNLHDMFERVIVQLKDRLSKKEHRVRDLEAKIMLEREQHELLLAEKDQEIAQCRQELKKQAETYRTQVENLTKKFNQQLEMCNKLVDLALKTNNLMKN